MLLLVTLNCAAWGAAGSSTDDSHYQARVRQLAEGFRCLVCQNQSLADSNADLAADLRAKIGEEVRQGATDAQVRAYMVHRYGDFVLYRPPVKPATWALWFGPFVALMVGVSVLWRTMLRRRNVQPRLLDEDERRRVNEWLPAQDESPLR
ncbi:cytochrome c-type biogenesis protein [Paraburkholderia xenovorans]|uniref:cytochrome c-type biogenesis protein n=1 Tax=Paraburkholderia xenovorans TaxID=36873 RepID=UPI00030D678E|nr:cytochrome c-type biogenesis protein [Paraburkholderia xenovorans]